MPLPWLFWLLLFSHCFPTSFFNHFCSLSAPKIDPKSLKILRKNRPTMRVLFRLRFCFLLDTFSVEHSNTRTFKIIKHSWFFLSVYTFSRFQVMQKLSQLFSPFTSLSTSKETKNRVPKRYKSVSIYQSIFGLLFSGYRLHFGSHLGSL